MKKIGVDGEEWSPDQVVKNLAENKELVNTLTKEMIKHCLKQGLDRFEVPTRIRFVKEVWLPDTGLVTDSLKLKRKEIEKFYQKDIELLYM